MEQENRDTQKQSIFQLLNFTVGNIAGLAIIAAIVAISLSIYIQQSVTEFSEKTFPTLEIVNDIATETKTIASLLKSVTLVSDLSAFEDISEKLKKSNDRIESGINQLKANESINNDRFDFKRPERLSELFSTQRRIVLEKLNLDKSYTKSEIDILKKVEKTVQSIELGIIDFEYDSLQQQNLLIGQASSTDIDKYFSTYYLVQELSELKSKFDGLYFSFGQIANEPSITTVEIYKNQFTSILREASIAVSALPESPFKDEIATLVSELFKSQDDKDSIFALRKKTLNLEEKIQQVNTWINNELTNLNNDFSIIFTNAKEKNQSAISLIKQRSNTAFFVFALIGIIITAVCYYTFIIIIRRQIAEPLKLVTNAINSVGDGNFNYLPFDKSSIELEDIDKALQVFIDNAKLLIQRETELVEKNTKLDESNESLQTFVRVSSHDLKSPLRGILLLCKMAEEDIDKNDHDKAKFNLSRINNRIKRLDKLLDSLLAYTKATDENNNKVPLNIGELIAAEFELLDHAGNFSLTLADKVGDVTIEESPFSMVIRNLLDNAIKHHDQDTGVITVTVIRDNTHISGNALIIYAEDDGPGIAPQYQQRIFEPFETLLPKDTVEGAGMGLAILRKITDRYQGSIHVQSPVRNNRGTCFIVTWPYEDGR